MEVLMHRSTVPEYSEDTAHTIEVIREENENKEFGSFGFTLLYEKPPIVGTIVPGGPAEKAGLKKDDIVLSVNGEDVTHIPHQNVVALISQTLTPGVWLKVCDSDQKSSIAYQSTNGVARGIQFAPMSQSTPNFRGMSGGGPKRRVGIGGTGGGGLYINDAPPKYSEVPPSRRHGSGGMNPQLGGRPPVMAMSMNNMSPLSRHVLTQHPKGGGSGQFQNGYGSAHHRPPQPASSNCFTSASVMVLYIGPVEIPETWSMRGISSKCIQECTRRLLSQRQEFIEAFLEVSITSMKVLNVSRNVLYKHKREELFYCGTCTDDEQYFAIVTRKIDPKLVDPEVGQTLHVPSEKPVQAHICHVFQVIRNKSVLVLHGGDRGGKGDTPSIKPKTIPIMSCLTIIKAIEGLFIGEATGGSIPSSRLFEDTAMNASNTSFRSTGSSGSNGSNESSSNYGSSPDKSKKKKDVVDLRPAAFNANPSSTSLPYSTYAAHETLSKSRDYLHPMDTPAFVSSMTSGKTWYKADSPRESRHVHQGSYDSQGRPTSGHFNDTKYDTARQEGRKGGFERVKKVSDESSLSSLSDRTPSPNKLTFRDRVSRSPSPSKSLSYSSGSRSRSPSPGHRYRQHRSPSPVSNSRGMSQGHGTLPRYTPSKLSAGLALEVASRNGAASPTSTVGSVRGYRSTLRRQGSESSVMDIQQDLIRPGLPSKTGPLSSSHGSMATVTTIADDERQNGQEEVGRVGGWIASIDKLLADPLGVLCLQQFLEKEHCEENILFWKDAKDFEEKAQRMTNVQILAAAKKIYDQYLSPSSPHTVNVDDRALKAVEAKLSNPPPNIFSEAQEQVYQLLKMDCYMRFKKSELVKECLLADMEGNPLPIGPAPQQLSTKNPWKKQREFGFGRSLFSRLGRNSRVTPPAPGQLIVPGRPAPVAPPKTKKDSKAGLKDKDSPLSRKTSREVKQEKRRSAAEVVAAEEFPPEKHLDILQAHKGNIFEVNLPNKVTKIMEVPKKGTVRDAINPVLRKHSYTLDVMGLKFADTLKPVNLDSPANILIGQHIIVLKSANTFTAVFPDGPERILPAGKRPVRELVAEVLNEMNKLQKFAVYVENSRVSFDDSIQASTLEGQRVTVKYLGGEYVPPEKNNNNMDELFSMIQRLASDTLEDQRTSPTPRNTPEPASPATPEQHHYSPSPSGGNLRAPRLSPRSSDSSPETRSKLSSRRRASSTHEKKSLSATRSVGRVITEQRPAGEGGAVEDSSRRFKRTQSGATISQRNRVAHENLKRSFSPPVSTDRTTSTTSPPPPASRPPPLPINLQPVPKSSHHGGHSHRSSEDLLQGNNSHQQPQYFPRAYPTIEREQRTLGLTVSGGSYPERLDSRAQRTSPVYGGRQYIHRSPSSPGNEQGHPLDNFVNEANVMLPLTTGHVTTGSTHSRQSSTPVQMTPESYPERVTNYPWHQAHPPNQRSRYSQQSRTAVQRHNLTENAELMKAADKLLQREIDEYRHHQLTSSHSSYSDASSTSTDQRAPLSPTTHMLVLPDDDGTEQSRSETFV